VDPVAGKPWGDVVAEEIGIDVRRDQDHFAVRVGAVDQPIGGHGVVGTGE
jgi:hypothetical protein